MALSAYAQQIADDMARRGLNPDGSPINPGMPLPMQGPAVVDMPVQTIAPLPESRTGFEGALARQGIQLGEDTGPVDQAAPQAVPSKAPPNDVRIPGLENTHATARVPERKLEREDFSKMAPMTDEQARRAGFDLRSSKDLNPADLSGVHGAEDTSKEPVHISKRAQAAPGASAGAGGGGGAGGGAQSDYAKLQAQLGAQDQGGGNFDEPYQQAAAAYAAQGEAEAQKAQAEGEAAKQRQLASAKQAADLELAQKKYQEVSEKHYASLEALNKQVADGQIDPDRWWHNQGTGRQIQYALAAALGGFAAGLRGIPNYPLQMIQHAIDNDIEAQKHNLEQKGRAAEGERSLLDEAYKMTGNVQQATILAKQVAYDQVANQLAEAQAKSNSTIARAGAMEHLAGINEKRQEMVEHQHEFAAGQADKLLMAMMRKKGGGGAGASNKEVNQLGSDLEKAHVIEVQAALDQARASLGAGHGAGLGRMKQFALKHTSGLGEGLLSSAGKDTQDSLRELGLVGSKLAGRVSKVSMDRLDHALQSGDPEQIGHAIDHIQGIVDAERKNIYRKHSPAAVQAYEERGGGEGSLPEGDDLPHGVTTAEDEANQ